MRVFVMGGISEVDSVQAHSVAQAPRWASAKAEEQTALTVSGVYGFFSMDSAGVVIKSGTNDFCGELPGDSDWVNQYRAFLTSIRSHYPDVQIFLCTGPMLGGAALKSLQNAVSLVVDAEKSGLFCGIFRAKMGRRPWCRLPPNLKTHQKMAENDPQKSDNK